MTDPISCDCHKCEPPMRPFKCGGCGCDTFRLDEPGEGKAIVATCGQCKSQSLIVVSPAYMTIRWPSSFPTYNLADGPGLLCHMPGDD